MSLKVSSMSRAARFASVVMQFAPFHHPHVFQIPVALLYHVCNVFAAVRARDCVVAASVIVFVSARARVERARVVAERTGRRMV
jgi:hypothetical protein